METDTPAYGTPENFTDVVWVVGNGRSGTTWLADLINFKGGYQEMFEPFHPPLIRRAGDFERFQYLRPYSTYESFHALASDIFSGRFRHARVDSYRRGDARQQSALLIKDIFSNLYIKWAGVNFPAVKKILILRHPCAVALSMLRSYRCPWLKEPLDFLRQPELMEDYLGPFLPVLERLRTPFGKLIAIWAIVHYVPLRQLQPGDVCLVFYENLCRDPENELKAVHAYLYGPESHFDPDILSKVNVASRTTNRDSRSVSGGDSVSGWRKYLDARSMARAVEILSVFGLNQIYGYDELPDRHAAERMLETNT